MSKRRILFTAVVLLGAGVLTFLIWAVRATPAVRDRVVNALNARFESKVELASLQVSVMPRPRVWGDGLVLRHMGRTDVPPLITIEHFDSSAGARGLLGTPLHLREVTLDGLSIRIPPGGLDGVEATENDEPRPPRDLPPPMVTAATAATSPILIDTIHARRARLEIPSRRRDRLPRIFDIEDMVMNGFGLPEGARYHTGLINPIPRGRIDTSGTFGPWNAMDPDLTPVQGEYVFKGANLDDIKGIDGTLASVGTYQGVLRRIDVAGQTETPDFSIDIAGQPVPLTTQFRAVVDGTNGDTWLEEVRATLARTTIVARGAVVRTQNVKGRRVTLDLQIAQGRIEDLMRLAVKAANTPLAGRIDLTTKFLLPQGTGDVVDRLQLDGGFTLAEARFTSIDIQKKINLLSSRGRGDENADGSGETTVSNLKGRFVLRNARLHFSNLTFSVPGASIQLAGTYGLRDETIDFSGYFLADATLADMTSGFKSMLARLAQPLFRRPGGGSRLPIRISGTRANPAFGLDVRRVFGRS
jgi:hypothetical protein